MGAQRSRKANAEPAGGGGGGWKAMNEKMGERRAKLMAKSKDHQKPEARRQTPSLCGGLTHGLTIGAYQHEGEEVNAPGSGTSIFDPVLTELVYRWFCPPQGCVLDPFAGGSVRGIVASRLGRGYTGIDLRPEQVKANKDQAKRICQAPAPQWIVGDSIDITRLAGKRKYDLIFSCPPYADLEVYSEDERDLSTMAHTDFLEAYRAIIAGACSLLADDRFAVFVIGDARDAGGFYYGLPWRTVEAFQLAGLRLYNEAVLITAAGSLPIRTAKQFTTSRKLGKTHQNIIIACKGDPVKATQAIGAVEFGEIELAPPAGAVDPAAFGEVL